MLHLTLPALLPFTGTLSPAQQARVAAWLPVLDQILNARYGDRITEHTEPAFISAAADAVMTRLARPGLIAQQTIGPAAVRYHDRAALLRWFLPEQLDELDAMTGSGNIRTVMLTAGTPLA
ncbi:hypothetical protein [Microbacterium oxydans]|uniref:hypothetical protein n=1 Tax=Microbacterium oxydans TaxID=82380 RepID=UPI000F8F8914|nr:hypothetical protein [Microbacterium oxydans]AZS48390.1 hypothetical protein CVS53_03110 [Microbacterium oxydans]